MCMKACSYKPFVEKYGKCPISGEPCSNHGYIEVPMANVVIAPTDLICHMDKGISMYKETHGKDPHITKRIGLTEDMLKAIMEGQSVYLGLDESSNNTIVITKVKEEEVKTEEFMNPPEDPDPYVGKVHKVYCNADLKKPEEKLDESNGELPESPEVRSKNEEYGKLLDILLDESKPFNMQATALHNLYEKAVGANNINEWKAVIFDEILGNVIKFARLVQPTAGEDTRIAKARNDIFDVINGCMESPHSMSEYFELCPNVEKLMNAYFLYLSVLKEESERETTGPDYPKSEEAQQDEQKTNEIIDGFFADPTSFDEPTLLKKSQDAIVALVKLCCDFNSEEELANFYQDMIDFVDEHVEELREFTLNECSNLAAYAISQCNYCRNLDDPTTKGNYFRYFEVPVRYRAIVTEAYNLLAAKAQKQPTPVYPTNVDLMRFTKVGGDSEESEKDPEVQLTDFS